MRAAANFAWGNRQLLMWQAREVFERIFGRTWEDLGMHLVYDVAHNIAKFEEHDSRRHGQARCGCTAKGRRAPFRPITRRFPRNTTSRPARADSRRHGPGKLGACWASRAAWSRPSAARATARAGCSSRTAAAKLAQGRRIEQELRSRGVIAQARSWQGLAEEQPDAYKDVDLVVDVVHRAGLAKKVVRLRPIGVIKG